jgi:septal ring factor EnvC (AmiA/AmiB activator)
LKRFTRTTLVITGLFLLGMGAPVAATTTDSAQAKAKEAELKRLRHSIKELTDNLGTLRNQHHDQLRKLRTLNHKISRLNQSLQDLEDQRRQQADKLAQLQAQRQSRQDQLTRQQQTLSKLLRAAYLLGQQSPIKILLNSTEPATVERSLRYYDYFYRSRAEHIAHINKTLVNLNTLEQNIQNKKQDLDTLVDRQRAQRATLRNSRGERNRLLAELNHDIQNTEQRLTQLKEDEKSLQDLVKRLGRALANIPSPGKAVHFARLKGRLPLPAQGEITAHFGSPRHVGQLKWQGIVINAADGADVQAVAAGRVVFADWLRGFGLLIILDHGDGYMSLYGYNQDLRKNVGDAVKTGETIATVGNNGSHNQSGLYFEIRHQGSPVNPLHWCKTRQGR